MCGGVATPARWPAPPGGVERLHRERSRGAADEIRELAPREGAEATLDSAAVGLGPASTRQDATPLPPLQLAVSDVVPSAAGEIFSVGGGGGGSTLVNVPDVSAVAPSRKSLSMLIVTPP